MEPARTDEPAVERATDSPALSDRTQRTVLWLAVLTRAELSQAYPFVGLSFVLTAIFGWLLFHDAMSVARIGGIALIMAGVVLVGRS